MTLQGFLSRIQTVIINPVIAMLFTVATLIFIWGIVQYVILGSQSDKNLTDGKRVIGWGLVGMFIMASAWGIVNVFCNFFGTCY